MAPENISAEVEVGAQGEVKVFSYNHNIRALSLDGTVIYEVGVNATRNALLVETLLNPDLEIPMQFFRQDFGINSITNLRNGARQINDRVEHLVSYRPWTELISVDESNRKKHSFMFTAEKTFERQEPSIGKTMKVNADLSNQEVYDAIFNLDPGTEVTSQSILESLGLNPNFTIRHLDKIQNVAVEYGVLKVASEQNSNKKNATNSWYVRT